LSQIPLILFSYSEEGIFKEYGYPETDKHLKIHKSFQLKIKSYLKEARGKANIPLAPLQDFLVEWILKHIQGEDRKYADYFVEKNIKPEINFSISDQTRNDVLSQWKQKKLSLEIKEIDDQHRELVGILQQTNDLQVTSEKRRRIFLPVIIKKLFYYSQYHFSYEEEHMAKNDYPLLREHQDLHRTFIKDIVKFTKDYKEGITTLTDDIIIFLKDWTITHILTEDKKYKEYLDSIKK